MALSGDKSKILVTKTSEVPQIHINVDNSILSPTQSERYLGLYFSSNMTWKNYLYGETRREKDNYQGLINILNTRLGMLRKISKHASKQKLMILFDGIIISKLRYNIGIYGNIWIKDQNCENQQRFVTFTKKDNERLQK